MKRFMLLQDKIKWKAFERFFWRDGDRFLNFLWGINISGGKVEPVYVTILYIWGGGGYLCIELIGRLLIMFRRRPPYVHVEWTREIEMEE